MAGEKTEKATPKRKQDERKKGNVFQSREVVSVFSLLIMFYSFKLIAPYFIRIIGRDISNFVSLSTTMDTITPSDVQKIFIDGCMTFAVTALPLLIIGAAATVIFTGAQTKFLFSSKLLEFKGNRMNPINGLKKMLSLRGLIELLKSLIKIVILGAILFHVFKKQMPHIPRLMDMTVEQTMAQVGSIVLSIVKTAVIFFVFLALFDYFYQWWDYEKNLRMSKQEIKEEFKQTEGDPQVKGKIKERQQQQARKRMMQAVPSADVVVRNPTHFAVAIRYDAEKYQAPVVVAKGADLIALKIVEIAENNGVTVMENIPLARGLYDAVDLDQEIPEQFYQPVAEVLAFVYSLKKKDLKQ